MSQDINTLETKFELFCEEFEKRINDDWKNKSFFKKLILGEFKLTTRDKLIGLLMYNRGYLQSQEEIQKILASKTTTKPITKTTTKKKVKK